MGDIRRRVWVSAGSRRIVSQRLQLLLLALALALGLSMFVAFVGGLLWLLIAVSRRATVQQLESMKLASYCLFGVGGVGIVACGVAWLLYVRLVREEVRQQELRHLPDMFKFPDESSATAHPAEGFEIHTAAAAQLQQPQYQHQYQQEYQQHQQQQQQQQQPQLQPQQQPQRPKSVRAFSSSSSSMSPAAVSVASSWRPLSQRTLPLERPQFVSQSESLTLGSMPASSRPSSVTTSSSKDQLIV